MPAPVRRKAQIESRRRGTRKDTKLTSHDASIARRGSGLQILEADTDLKISGLWV